MAARSRKRADEGDGSERDDYGAAAETAGRSFEESHAELEAIVDRLEGGELPLEEALAAFEAGVALTRRCAEQLGDAERKVEALMRNGATWVTKPFEEPSEADD